jgi:hypothetical protein
VLTNKEVHEEMADAYGDHLPVVAVDQDGQLWPITEVTTSSPRGEVHVTLVLGDKPLD